MNLSKSTWVAIKFVLHIFIGVGGFLLVAVAAILLNKFTHYAESEHLLPDLIVKVMIGLEWVLFAIDIVCFAFFLGVETYNQFIETRELVKKSPSGGADHG